MDINLEREGAAISSLTQKQDDFVEALLSSPLFVSSNIQAENIERKPER